ncbi:MAG: winged helix-turn-helix domain-containing protein [Firmicutes bacterium]|nr:winged helix-turn-helix domain-containing protein [Bacillota bacterium]
MNPNGLTPSSYEEYTKLFDALSHPMRIKIIGILTEGRRYVSELAKIVNMSRPLLYMHLKKLEDAALVTGSYEISDLGKSMKFYELKSFSIHLTPKLLAELSHTISLHTPQNHEGN